MRLIDADELMARLRNDPLFALIEPYNIEGVIAAAPTIEAEPVRRGRWVEESGMFMCSVCHDVWGTEEMIKGFNYCPWCGAKMEEQE